MRPDSAPAPQSRRQRAARLAYVLGLIGLGLAPAGCQRAPRNGGAELSFLVERQRWRATSSAATVERLASDGGPEWSIQVVARRDPEGERLTLFAHAAQIEGTHPLRAFGALRGFAAAPAGLTPVTNVCGSGADAAPDGTITVERHDVAAHTLSGTFLVNVCDVEQTADAKTLADGRFAHVAYTVPADGSST